MNSFWHLVQEVYLVLYTCTLVIISLGVNRPRIFHERTKVEFCDRNTSGTICVPEVAKVLKKVLRCEIRIDVASITIEPSICLDVGTHVGRKGPKC